MLLLLQWVTRPVIFVRLQNASKSPQSRKNCKEILSKLSAVSKIVQKSLEVDQKSANSHEIIVVARNTEIVV